MVQLEELVVQDKVRLVEEEEAVEAVEVVLSLS
jgi:hypothetical protein